ncbi:MAG TPA: hypothetical protein VM054_05690 [bacterium]|nr:hypothetical protein [bacterium]
MEIADFIISIIGIVVALGYAFYTNRKHLIASKWNTMVDNIYTYRGTFYGDPPETYRILENKATSQWPQVLLAQSGDNNQFSRSECLFLKFNLARLEFWGFYLGKENLARSAAPFAGMIPKKMKIITVFPNDINVGKAYVLRKSYFSRIVDVLRNLSQSTALSKLSLLRLLFLVSINQPKYLRRFINTRFEGHYSNISLSAYGMRKLWNMGIEDVILQLKYSLIKWPDDYKLNYKMRPSLYNLLNRYGFGIRDNSSGEMFYGLIQPNTLCKPIYLPIMSTLPLYKPSMMNQSSSQ